MRHGKKFNHLSRTAPHRKAMLSNMASSLIQHKRITTTVAKAKALRKYVEPLITKAKDDTTHSRRVVFSYLQDKDSVSTLFNEIAEKVAARPGGYTRIIKTNNRLGDNADMCIIELVDYNELLLTEAAPKKKSTRRRGGKKKAADTAVEATATEAVVEEAVVEEAVVEEATVEETTPEVEEVVEAEVEETTEAATEEEEAPAAEAGEATEPEASADDSEEEKKDAE
ncbi:50S ribosomal protein L17 [Roseivirga sp. 4D4]|uniref:50S ribosomal protein L17 n=1 Tax=Roseivirga sp. 4D4 TaxID=1889784 RepID=UPI000852CA08|nr:50S ribosomal protein L17 [Roseivirga sp. 4D4]OEK03571.1 50S ribosomal protein L17 [Roseivirga sp. 4D4]